MAQSSLKSRIINAYGSLTKSEKKVADQVLADPGKAVYLSITELAELSGVGDASVFRFCKSLDLKGYQDFKLQLSLGLTNDAVKSADERNGVNSSLEQRLLALRNKTKQTIEETLDLLDHETLEGIVRDMLQAKRMFFCGVGTSMLSAMEAMNRFMRINTNAFAFVDAHMQAMAASLFTPGDIVFVFSYSGNTKDSVQIAKLAKEAGAKVIGISRYAKSPLTAHASAMLLCGSTESPLQGGSAMGKTSQSFIIDVLYNEYFRATKLQSEDNLKLTSAAVLEKLF